MSVKRRGTSMDNRFQLDWNQLAAGFAGAMIGTDWKQINSVIQGVVTVAAGAFSALYLTPLIAEQLGWTKHSQLLGLSFLIGTLGLRSVQWMNKFIESKMNKLVE